MLAQFTFSNPVTVQAISEQLKLSSRTILRELPKIERWMEENDFHMIRKPRVGIYLEESKANRSLILELVEADATKASTMEKEERICRIEHEILSAEEPIKYFYLTSKFQISEGTLIGDLEEVAKWFSNYGLTLVKRKGLGVYWAGNEQDYRQAVVALMVAELVYEDSHPAINPKERRTGLPLFLYYSKELLTMSKDLIRSVEQSLKTRYTENSAKRISFLLLVTMQRIRNGYVVEELVEDVEVLMRYPEYQAATWIASAIEGKMEISVSPEEIGFLTMQLLSAKVWKPQVNDKYESENIRNRQLVIHMILKVEQLLDMEFLDDRMLIDGLCNHIGPALSRMKMNVHIENNNVDMLKKNYLHIFEAVKTASKILKAEIGGNTICDEELGFLALHFCAAAEKKNAQSGKICVLIACPNGIGTSHMLAVHIQKAFPEIRVRKVISTSDITMDFLIREGVDLIVSTSNLDIDFPHVCVNPVLLENDRILIRNAIRDLKKTRGVSIRKSNVRRRIRSKEIEYFVSLGEEILQVIENIKISRVEFVESREELVEVSSHLFARNSEKAKQIEKDIQGREKLASTYISTFQMVFLHCKTKAIDHCRFGYVSLKKPLVEREGVILGAIVMLVPERGNNSNLCKEVMSEVSGSLAENDTLVEYLIAKERNKVSFELEKSLGNYYQRVMKEYGEF